MKVGAGRRFYLRRSKTIRSRASSRELMAITPSRGPYVWQNTFTKAASRAVAFPRISARPAWLSGQPEVLLQRGVTADSPDLLVEHVVVEREAPPERQA